MKTNKQFLEEFNKKFPLFTDVKVKQGKAFGLDVYSLLQDGVRELLEQKDKEWKKKMIEVLEGLTNPEDWHGWEGYGRHTNAEIKEQINNLKQL